MRRFGLAMCCIAVTVLVVALVRLSETLAQLRAIEAFVVMPADADEPLPAAPDEATVGAPGKMLDIAPPIDMNPASGLNVGDDHIMRALTDDAEFKRAAAELLHDPDPAVRAEAEQLLRDLGL